MVSIGYRLRSIGAVVVNPLGCMVNTEHGLLRVGDLAEKRAVSIFMRISHFRETPCGAPSLRSTANWLLARRSVVGAASQIHRESNHGETRKGGPLWGLKARLTVWQNHCGSEAVSREFGTESWWFRIMVLSRFGGPKTASATGQAHPHSWLHSLENPKD